MDTRTVGEMASLAGITVRTLHHYDEIGLLTPSERRDNGYRAYSGRDVDRLQQILAYRELDMSLEEIARILDAPASTVDALTAAKERVSKHIKRLHRIEVSLANAIRAQTEGATMTPEEKLRAFGDFDPDRHADEAEQRWGGTAAFTESQRRTTSYSPEDWETMRAEQDKIYAQFVELMSIDESTDSPVAAHLVDSHRHHISKWFYDCTPEIHTGLGAMYVTDERFRSNIDTSGDGLAEYMSQAIAARYSSI